MKRVRRFNNRFFCLLAGWIVLGLGYRGLGGFISLHVVEKDMGPYTIAYASFTGRLANAHSAIDMVRDTLSNDDIRFLGFSALFGYTYKAGKIYLTTMAAGMWIDPQDASKINQTSDLYMTQTIASGEKLMITFPYKSSFSCVIGHLRCTKKIHEYLKSKKYTQASIIEIIDRKNHTVSYLIEPKE